jgi:hypothetical protein
MHLRGNDANEQINAKHHHPIAIEIGQITDSHIQKILAGETDSHALYISRSWQTAIERSSTKEQRARIIFLLANPPHPHAAA